MPRARRPYLPGAVFHLTARTQGHHPWFTAPVRDRIVAFAAEAISVSDAWLLAYAIMPNHLHLVVRQGESSLGELMQPFLRRVALLVQRTHATEGHVFERRFSATYCIDPDHARNAIVYSHLNPVRAGLASRPGDYSWTSHWAYLGRTSRRGAMADMVTAEEALALFAPRRGAGTAELRRTYRRVVAWRMERDRAQRATTVDASPLVASPPHPAVVAGCPGWMRLHVPLYNSRARVPTDGAGGAASVLDLRDIALRTLSEHAPDLPLERVRSSDRGAAVVRARRLLVRRMSRAGFAGRTIARYLRVSEQCVSNIRRSDLRAGLS